MKHIVEKIELVDNEIRLVDPEQEKYIRVLESADGVDLAFILPGSDSYIVVDSRLMLGSLKALVAQGERKRINSRVSKEVDKVAN